MLIDFPSRHLSFDTTNFLTCKIWGFLFFVYLLLPLDFKPVKPLGLGKRTLWGPFCAQSKGTRPVLGWALVRLWGFKSKRQAKGTIPWAGYKDRCSGSFSP